MKTIIIGTWRMALDGITKAQKSINLGIDSNDIIEIAIKEVENNESYLSVGYGGLPNLKGVVELDAAMMDGDTLSVGAVAAMSKIKNPISVAKVLMKQRINNFLAGKGAEEFALEQGFEKTELLTAKAKEKWLEKLKEFERKEEVYQGHDTVGVIALDKNQKISVGTSTSGLFLKKPGRVGDSPLIGSGFYADSKIGAATATGLGEDIMKGVISYEVVKLIESGLSPQEAAQKSVETFSKRLVGIYGEARDISVICIDRNGNWGAATNAAHFSFVVAENNEKPTVYLASYKEEKLTIKKASGKWIKENNE